MAVKQYEGSFIQPSDIETGNFPYSEQLFSQGYTYDPIAGWQAPQATPSAPSVWGKSTGSAAPDFTKYGQYPGTTTAKKYTPTAGLMSGGGTSGLRYKPPTGSTTVSRTIFPGEAPKLDLPEREEARVRALTRKAMAPRLRNLRTALNRALVRTYENPNVRRMVVREALQGYGAGVEEARYGAERTAEQQEAAERATEIQENLANYQGAMQAFLASGQKVTQVKQQYDTEGTAFGGGSRLTTGRASLGGAYGIYEKPTIWSKPKPPEDFEF